jgi:signal transduction histidine kinase
VIFATTALIAAAGMVVIGGAILWANPRRNVNRAVFACAMNLVAWLVCWHLAVAAPSGHGLAWVRWTTSVGALVALSYWLVKEVGLAPPDLFSWRWFRRHWPWFVITTFLVVVPFTDAFIPPTSTADHHLYGPGYYGYIAGSFVLYFLLVREAAELRRLTDERRVELRLWITGGATMFIVIEVLMVLSMVTGNSFYRHCEPVVILVFYGGVSYAVTAHRIFDARHVTLVVMQKLALVLAVLGIAIPVFLLMRHAVPLAWTVGMVAIVAAVVAVAGQRWLDRRFEFYPEAAAAREALFGVAAMASTAEALERGFVEVLQGWSTSERAFVAFGPESRIHGSATLAQAAPAVMQELRQLRWATPERLQRERDGASHDLTADFLRRNRLGAAVCVHASSLTILAGVGPTAARRPYTFAQIEQLLELATIMKGAFERAHFSAKARQAEQLATVGLLGASVAHEIRNPLVAIRTFVQMLPAQHGNPAFREKFFQLIADEVQRMDQLTHQLLDLASPRLYSATTVELRPAIQSTLDLINAKAAPKSVIVRTDFGANPDVVCSDAAAIKQVLLNLCFNAIQAMERTPIDRRQITIATRNTDADIEMSVSDSGPGIAPEMLPRLFEHFQTSKSSGFGLGLAICRDTLESLGATIAVDPPALGVGATFRVRFPTPAR